MFPVRPPLPEQQEIVRRVEGLFALADQLELRLAKAREQAAWWSEVANIKFDFICEKTHGCDPLGIPDSVFIALQQTDPRPRVAAG